MNHTFLKCKIINLPYTSMHVRPLLHTHTHVAIFTHPTAYMVCSYLPHWLISDTVKCCICLSLCGINVTSTAGLLISFMRRTDKFAVITPRYPCHQEEYLLLFFFFSWKVPTSTWLYQNTYIRACTRCEVKCDITTTQVFSFPVVCACCCLHCLSASCLFSSPSTWLCIYKHH